MTKHFILISGLLIGFAMLSSATELVYKSSISASGSVPGTFVSDGVGVIY